MKKIVLAHDWIGPEGPWPNGQSLDFYVDSNSYEPSLYSVSNKHNYNLESYRHLYTYSKLESVIGKRYKRKHINDCTKKFVYELTPLLKPYQWVGNAFDNVSQKALQHQRQGNCLFVINDLYEGYSNKHYNFFENIHHQIEKNKLIFENVFYITMNVVLKDAYDTWCAENNIKHKIQIHCIFVFEHLYNKSPITTPNKHFICLNRQPNPYRQCLVYELWRRDLLKYGHVSMPDPSSIQDVEFSKENLKMFDLDDSMWDEFIASLPYEVDGRDFTAQTCEFNTIGNFYQDSLYAIITENTYGNDDCIKLTEKTFNAFDNYCIPLHFYNTGITCELSKIGYEVDESLNHASSKEAKFFALLDKIEALCKIPIQTLNVNTLSMRFNNHCNLKKRSKQKTKKHLEIFKEWQRFW